MHGFCSTVNYHRSNEAAEQLTSSLAFLTFWPSMHLPQLSDAFLFLCPTLCDNLLSDLTDSSRNLVYSLNLPYADRLRMLYKRLPLTKCFRFFIFTDTVRRNPIYRSMTDNDVRGHAIRWFNLAADRSAPRRRQGNCAAHGVDEDEGAPWMLKEYSYKIFGLLHIIPVSVLFKCRLFCNSDSMARPMVIIISHTHKHHQLFSSWTIEVKVHTLPAYMNVELS